VIIQSRLFSVKPPDLVCPGGSIPIQLLRWAGETDVKQPCSLSGPVSVSALPHLAHPLNSRDLIPPNTLWLMQFEFRPRQGPRRMLKDSSASSDSSQSRREASAIFSDGVPISPLIQLRKTTPHITRRVRNDRQIAFIQSRIASFVPSIYVSGLPVRAFGGNIKRCTSHEGSLSQKFRLVNGLAFDGTHVLHSQVMTVLAAVSVPGGVLVGSDRALTDGMGQVSVCTTPKFQWVGCFYLGLAGTYVGAWEELSVLGKHSAPETFHDLFELLGQSDDASGVIVHRGQLHTFWWAGTGWASTRVKDAFCGSGGDLCRGAWEALKGLGPPHVAMRKSLQIAGRHCASVKGPYDVKLI
jgi:hypothetical protein